MGLEPVCRFDFLLPFLHDFNWVSERRGCIVGPRRDRSLSYIGLVRLKQAASGLHWYLRRSYRGRHAYPCWRDWIQLLARIRGYGRRSISFLPRSGSTTTGSPIYKFGRRIASLLSNLISITQSVPQTIAAVHCRSDKGFLILHYTRFESAEGTCVLG